jgi:phospholipid/cholesterol/gamma-HCH transport system permease protein
MTMSSTDTTESLPQRSGTLEAPGRQAPGRQAPDRRVKKRFSGSDVGAKAMEPLLVAGEMWSLMIKVFGMIIRRPWGFWGEVRDQSWDMFKLTFVPMALTSFGFGFGAPGLQGGNIFYLFGIPYRLGSFFEFASIREFAPFIDGMVVAGVIGTAMTADLGARRIREEIDAMEVLGVDPIRTLVLPRVVATTIMTAVLDIMALIVGLISGYVAAVPMLKGNNQSYVASLYDLLNTADMWGSVVKCAIYGLIIAIVCCYMGLHAKGGPIGVGKAVNKAVVISFAGVWVINFIFTTTLLGTHPAIEVFK